ncbi:regucalcin-like [Cylas formicarius]|uniref:regucalcin-like n=1 Tax=Cylas formicarius TaxID=197179 RepID=UPI0029589BD3|nr:regucalcin-like [Cylas formicarius]
MKTISIIFLVAVTSTSLALDITPVTPPVQHAEGPHWDPVDQVLYYVDTFQATILRWDPKTELFTSHKLQDRKSIGVITPIKDTAEQYIVAADRLVYYFQWDGFHNDTGIATELFEVEPQKPNNQFNDGKADANGNMWIGTLTRNDDLGVTSFGGSLYRIEISLDYHDEIEAKENQTSISNGIAWSSDNKFMFFIDSALKKVFKFDFDGDSVISNERVLFDLADHSELSGIPDGMTIDTDENLWVALFGGSAIIQVHPVTGDLLQVVPMPVQFVTSLCFGGGELEILYATTSRLHLNEEGVQQQPSAGSVLSIEGLGVKGRPDFEVVLNN